MKESSLTLRCLSCRAISGLDSPAYQLEQLPLESLVERAVDHEVHDGVEDQQQVVHRGHAHEPHWGEPVVGAADHLKGS